MEVSDVRVRVVDNESDRLKAVCTVTLGDAFVVRDVKIVEGSHGLFVAMPSRKLTAPCPKCRTQNHLRARHCNDCGRRLPAMRIPCDDAGREKAHRDMAHPINATFRQAVEECVLKAYETERERLGSGGGQVEAGDDDLDAFDSDAPAVEERESLAPINAASQAETYDDDAEDSEALPTETSGGSQMSEYNSLIADLRGGANNPSGQRPRGGQPSSPSGNRPSSQGDGPSDGDREKRPRRSRGGRGRSRRSESAAHEDSPPRRDSQAEAAPRVAETRPAPAPQVRETPPPRKPEPPRPEPTKTSEVKSYSFDDTQSFGAGLAEETVSKPRPKPKKAAAVKPPPVKEEAVNVEPDVPDVGSVQNENAFGAGLL